MSEIIELKTFSKNESDEIFSDEYHEISHEVIFESEEIYPLKTTTPIKEYDFFTCTDNNSSMNSEFKKKKTKKKRKSKNVMDIILSELAAKPLLIENNMTMIDHSTERASYLEQVPRMDRIFQKRRFREFDTENGIPGVRRMDLAPIFPLVLENRTNKHVKVPTVKYQEPVLFNDIVTEYATSEERDKKSGKFLDLVLSNISFKHHHEFSLEELLCVKATELYDTYENIKKHLADTSKAINVNRKTRNSLKEQLIELSPNRQDEVKFDKNILKYTKLMIDAKYKYCDIVKKKKLIVHQIVSLWEDIKMVREKYSHTKNNLMIDIKRKEFDQNEYEQQWLHLFEIEYTDMITKIEFEYVTKYLEYKELKHEKNGSNVPKPKLEIDYDNIQNQVEEVVNEIMSDDKYEISIKQNSVIGIYKNKARKTSFAKNFSFKVFVDDIFVCESGDYENKRNPFSFDASDSMTIEILPHNQMISIILFENTEAVSFYKVQLSDVKKNKGEVGVTAQEFVYNKIIEPTSKCIGSGFDIKTIAAKNKVRLKSSNIFKGKQYTRCEVYFKLLWNDKLNKDESESIKSAINVKQMLLRVLNGKEITLHLLTDAISGLYGTSVEGDENIRIALKSICKPVINKTELFDENDTEHSRFRLLRLRNVGGLSDISDKCIPLFGSQFSTEQLGCLQNNKEDEVDYYKFQNGKVNTIDLQRFIGMKFVEKLNENLKSVVNSLLLKKTYKDVVRDFEDLSLRGILSNSANLLLNETSKYTKQQILEESLLKEQEICVTVARAFNLLDRATDEGGDDKSDEDIAGFSFHPLRPLVRVSYRGATAQTTTAMGCHPTWNNTLKLNSILEPLSSIHIDVYDQCKETLESQSDDRSGQSTVNYRKYNKWLGGIRVPMYAVLDLGNVRGAFKLNVPPLMLGYDNASSNSQPTSVSKLMSHMKRDASLLSLQITTSISYLGGQQTYSQPLPNDSDDDFIIRQLNDFVTEYNNDFPSRDICLTFIDSSKRNKCVTEFIQPLPLPSYDYFPLDPRKTESALSKSSGRSKSSSSKGSRRRGTFEVDKEDLDTWKTDENMLTKNMDAAVRYVSLVPTYELKSAHVVTLTGVELLKVMYGSPLDHTILLASYFLCLGIKCWIITGFGLPRGQSSYVLVKYYNDKPLMLNENVKTGGFFSREVPFTWYIYDAAAGDKFILRQIGCPLRTVSYVFDCDNIWVNVQNSPECESVSFDFNKSSDWKAVFSKPIYIPRPVPESLYSKPNAVEDLRSCLETKIKNKVQKWRSHVKTVWNRLPRDTGFIIAEVFTKPERKMGEEENTIWSLLNTACSNFFNPYCSSLLRETLPQWEYWSFNPSQPRPALGHRLKQLMATYKIFGFPINMSYLNTNLVTSRVKWTSLHANDDPSAEFGLAVEVFAYPNNVLSVWVFLASITRL